MTAHRQLKATQQFLSKKKKYIVTYTALFQFFSGKMTIFLYRRGWNVERYFSALWNTSVDQC